jgi:hypothetical protein
MSVRSSSLALALMLALPGPAIAQSFEYAPTKAQYRLTSTTKGAQEAMGQKQEFESSNSQLLSVTLARQTRDTVALTVVLDSITAVGPMGMVPPGLDKLIGIKVSAKLSPFGAVYASEGPADTTIANLAQITEEMGRFLPRIRGKLAAGSTWTDTTSGKVKQNGLDIDRTVVSKFTVVGDTSVAGEKGWKIARESNTSLSGTGAPQGQPMTMEGKSNGKGTLVVSQKGVFVGSQQEDQANIKITLAANGMEIGVTTTANTKVEKIK